MITGEIQMDSNAFELLVDSGKKMKTTFTVYDPYSHHIVYGFNGEGFSCRESQIGALKYIEMDRTIYTNFNLFFRFVVYTKDIVAMLKMSKDMIADVKCSVKETKIMLYYRKILDRIDIRSIKLVDQDNSILMIIPTFRSTLFYNTYLELTHDLNTVDALDITDDHDMINLLASKAIAGAKHVRYNNINLYVTGNLFNINKGDRIIASHTDELHPRILMKVIKKKNYIINIIFRILNI